jgi:ribonuclease HIII
MPDRVLEQAVEMLRKKAAKVNSLIETQPIQYGVKLHLSGAEGTSSGVLYHSPKKRRFSFVPQNKGDQEAAMLLAALVAEVTGLDTGVSRELGSGDPVMETVIDPISILPPREQKLGIWMGSDEAGKGDMFGPLVAAGFKTDKQTARDIYGMGVMDSKNLPLAKIRSIATKLLDKYPERIAVVELDPDWYNAEYPGYMTEGGINGLLGWAHAAVIAELSRSEPLPEAAVVDRFGEARRITDRYMGDIHYAPLLLRPRAEDNPAVAAGAILAKDRFETALDRYREELGWRPHAGSGEPANRDLRRLFKQEPRNMAHFVKMHFGPVKRLLDQRL